MTQRGQERRQEITEKGPHARMKVDSVSNAYKIGMIALNRSERSGLRVTRAGR